MKYRAQVFSEELLPAFRMLLAEHLSSEYGLTQDEIAAKLDVSQAMVSNYVSTGSETAQKLAEDPQIVILIEKAASKAAQGENYVQELRDLVSQVQDRSIIEGLSRAERVL